MKRPWTHDIRRLGLALAAAAAMAAPALAQTIRLQASGDPAELAGFRDLITAFKTVEPGVQVEFIPVGKARDHMAKLTTGFAAGDPPDLFLINFRRFGQFASRGVLEPLGPALGARGKFKEADYYEQAMEAFRETGTLTCVPLNISSLVVYYNVTLFKEAHLAPPKADWTWGDFFAAAKALTRDTNGDGKTDIYGLGLEPALIRAAPFVWQAGGEVVDDLRNPTRFTLDTPAARDALEFIRSWSLNKVVPTQAENRSEDPETRFARGGLGMLLNSRRATPTLRAVPGLDWDVAPLPRHTSAATVLHSDAYCLSKASKSKDAALRFLEFALGEAGAAISARSGRTVPSLKKVAQGPDFLDPKARPRSAQVFLDSIPLIRRTPNMATWNEIEARVDPLVEGWFYSARPPLVPLNQDLNEASQGLFARPSKP